eukprot:TRINITY_DN5163_c0_g2_i1.p1 TRINITY_DN5163_c0_g2~~TRINITY_DN5163_c0_g2_i1.p1  ORF type:complete len:1072 (+),score=385.87 TRINITY_DN5163_c0_g2_i1:65-3280(+)
MLSPEVFQYLLHPDNALRRQAEDAFWNAVKTVPDSAVGVLMKACQGDMGAGHQLLAAVLLRKVVGDNSKTNCWEELSEEVQAECKEQLLQMIPAALPQAVRTQVELTVGKVGARLIPEGEWDALPDLLLQGSVRDPRGVVRASSIEIFAEIFSWLGNTAMKAHLKTLRTVLAKGLADLDPAVKLASAEAVLHVSAVLKNEAAALDQFASLLPPIMQLLAGALNDPSQEGFALALLDALVLTAEAQPAFFPAALKDILAAMLSVTTSSALDEQPRFLALELMVCLCEGLPKKVFKLKTFIPTLLDAAVGIIKEHAPNPNEFDMNDWGAADPEDDDDEYVGIMHSFACDGLDRLSHALGGKAFYKHLVEKTSPLLQSGQWVDVYTGVTMLHHAAEGCITQMAEDLKGVIPILVGQAGAGHPLVKYAALDCLAQFCFDFFDLQEKYHEPVLSCATACLGDAVPRVQVGAANLINCFFNQLNDSEEEEEAARTKAAFTDAYFDALITKLLAVVEAPLTPNFVRARALAAASEVMVNTSEPKMHSVQAHVFPQLLRITTTAHGLVPPCPKLVAEAVGAVSWAAKAVGSAALPDALVSEILNLLSAIHQTVTDPEDPRAEALLEAYARLAETLEARYIPHLEKTLPVVLQRAAIENPGRPLQGLFESDLEDCITLPDGTVVAVNTALVNEKEKGLSLLADFARALGQHFPPATKQDVLKVMFASISSPYRHEIRVEAAKGVMNMAAHDPALVAPFLDALLASFHMPFQKAEGLVVLLKCFSDALRVAPNTLSADLGEPLAKGLLEVLRSSVQRQLDEDSTDAGADDEDGGEEEDDDDDSGAPDNRSWEDKLQERVGVAMETAMVFQPQCRDALARHLAPGFADLVKEDSLLSEFALQGLISFLEKGIVHVLPVAAPTFLACCGNGELDETSLIAACLGVGASVDLYTQALAADPNRAGFCEQAFHALSQVIQTRHTTAQSACVAAATSLLKLQNDAACLPVVLALLPFSEDVDGDVEEAAQAVHRHVVALAAQQSPALLPHKQKALAVLKALAQAKDSCVVDDATAAQAKQAVMKLR